MSPALQCYQVVQISPLLFLTCFAVPSFMHFTSAQFAIVKPIIKIIIIFFIFLTFHFGLRRGHVYISFLLLSRPRFYLQGSCHSHLFHENSKKFSIQILLQNLARNHLFQDHFSRFQENFAVRYYQVLSFSIPFILASEEAG